MGGNGMAKYRKKPVEVEAIKFNGDALTGNYEDVVKFMQVNAGYSTLNKEILVLTSKSTIPAEDGDYILKDTNGELSICKPDIFEKTYELVKEGDKT